MNCLIYKKESIQRIFNKLKIYKYYQREMQIQIFYNSKKNLIFKESKPCR